MPALASAAWTAWFKARRIEDRTRSVFIGFKCLDGCDTFSTATLLHLFRQESEQRRFLQRLTRPDHDRRKVLVMDGIGVVLGFQADAGVFQVVAGVKLH